MFFALFCADSLLLAESQISTAPEAQGWLAPRFNAETVASNSQSAL
jgi:hypothetical protein